MQVSIHHKVLAEFSDSLFDLKIIQQRALESWLSSNQNAPVRFLEQTSKHDSGQTYHFFEVLPHKTKANCLVVRI